MKDLAARMHGRKFGRGLDGRGGNVLKFKCYYVDTRRKRANSIEVLVRSSRFIVGDLAGRRVRIRRECMDAVGHLPRLDGEHTAQLAAAKDTDRRAWKNDPRH